MGARQGSQLSPSSFQFSPTSMDKFSSPSDIERHVSDQTNSRPSSRLHETHFGASVNSMVHSPIEVSSLSPDQLHITPIATIDGRTGPGRDRRRRSVRRGLLMVMVVLVVDVEVEVPPMASWQEPDSSLLAQRRPLIGCHTSSSGQTGRSSIASWAASSPWRNTRGGEARRV